MNGNGSHAEMMEAHLASRNEEYSDNEDEDEESEEKVVKKLILKNFNY